MTTPATREEVETLLTDALKRWIWETPRGFSEGATDILTALEQHGLAPLPATLRTERDEAFKLLERLEALRSDRWPTDLADVLTQAADMLKVVGEITAYFRTLIAKGK